MGPLLVCFVLCAAGFTWGVISRQRQQIRDMRKTLDEAVLALEEGASLADELATSLSEWRECCRRLLVIVAPQEAEALGREIADVETRMVLARASLQARAAK